MAGYRLLDKTNVDQIELDLVLKEIENPSSLTTAETPSCFLPKDTGNSSIKLIIVAGALAISSIVGLKFSKPNNSQNSLMEFNRTIEKPHNAFIAEFNKLTMREGHITKKEIIDKIVAFRSLNENWDGYGAVPLEVKSASNAIQFMFFLDDRVVERLSDVFPEPNGTVSCVWENDANERVALEFGNNTLSYYVKLNSQEPRFFNEIEVNAKEANTISSFIKTI